MDDGSRDKSIDLLRAESVKVPDRVVIVELSRNFEHPAILAGFSIARGDAIVTLDADLQNPPEEIAKLLAKMDEGFDVVGGVRQQRQDGVVLAGCLSVVVAPRSCFHIRNGTLKRKPRPVLPHAPASPQ